MTMTRDYAEEIIRVADTQVQLLKGGSGSPLLLLHGAGGNLGWMRHHRALAEHYRVYAPSHPGYDKSGRLEWINTITDVAHFYLQFMAELGMERIHLMGFSMGGWLAAEMAAMCSHNLKSLVLVDAAGIKPTKGEIAEIFMISQEALQKLRFYDPGQVPDADIIINKKLTPEEEEIQWRNREMAARLCWRPYLHNPSLPGYLRSVKTPTLILWGRQDAILPLNCGELYHQYLPNSTLHVIDRCGHSPQTERPQEFLQVVSEFLSRHD